MVGNHWDPMPHLSLGEAWEMLHSTPTKVFDSGGSLLLIHGFQLQGNAILLWIIKKWIRPDLELWSQGVSKPLLPPMHRRSPTWDPHSDPSRLIQDALPDFGDGITPALIRFCEHSLEMDNQRFQDLFMLHDSPTIKSIERKDSIKFFVFQHGPVKEFCVAPTPPSLSHWTLYFCLHKISSCFLHCLRSLRTSPSWATRDLVFPSRLIFCWIDSMACSNLRFSWCILSKSDQFHSLIFPFNSFSLSWQISIEL